MSCPMVDKYLQPIGCRLSGDVAGAGARLNGHGRCGNGNQPGLLSQYGIELCECCTNFSWFATAAVGNVGVFWMLNLWQGDCARDYQHC